LTSIEFKICEFKIVEFKILAFERFEFESLALESLKAWISSLEILILELPFGSHRDSRLESLA